MKIASGEFWAINCADAVCCVPKTVRGVFILLKSVSIRAHYWIFLSRYVLEAIFAFFLTVNSTRNLFGSRIICVLWSAVEMCVMSSGDLIVETPLRNRTESLNHSQVASTVSISAFLSAVLTDFQCQRPMAHVPHISKSWRACLSVCAATKNNFLLIVDSIASGKGWDS